MKRLPAFVALVPLSLALAACGEEGGSDSAAGDGRSAAGEILDRSITDEMLPYDVVRSQAPLAALEEVEGDEPASAAAANGAPAEEPAAEEPEAAE